MTRYVDSSIHPSICLSICPSILLLLRLRLRYYSCPIAWIAFFITAPAHPHATPVAVYTALFLATASSYMICVFQETALTVMSGTEAVWLSALPSFSPCITRFKREIHSKPWHVWTLHCFGWVYAHLLKVCPLVCWSVGRSVDRLIYTSRTR